MCTITFSFRDLVIDLFQTQQKTKPLGKLHTSEISIDTHNYVGVGEVVVLRQKGGQLLG